MDTNSSFNTMGIIDVFGPSAALLRDCKLGPCACVLVGRLKSCSLTFVDHPCARSAFGRTRPV